MNKIFYLYIIKPNGIKKRYRVIHNGIKKFLVFNNNLKPINENNLQEYHKLFNTPKA
jgi:hypothetical protein